MEPTTTYYIPRTRTNGAKARPVIGMDFINDRLEFPGGVPEAVAWLKSIGIEASEDGMRDAIRRGCEKYGRFWDFIGDRDPTLGKL